MTKREQLQAEIIEKWKGFYDFILPYIDFEKMSHEDNVRVMHTNHILELSALTTALEKEGEEGLPKVLIGVSPSKNEKVCGNCEYFTLRGVTTGTCLRKDLRGNNNRTERDTCSKFTSNNRHK